MEFDKKVDYRTCFSTDAGKRVLADLLSEAGFFTQLVTPEQQAVENFMKCVLSSAGMCPVETDKDRIDEYITNLLNMPLE